MVKEELIQRSPLRVFEKSIHGGLKAGEIGIIASKRGIGKTSVLVQLALDNLMQGKKVIHISFVKHTHYVLDWYENIFDEFINRKDLENTSEIKDEIIKNRVLMNFNQELMSKEQIIKSLRAMIVEGGFAAEALIIDGFDFSSTPLESIKLIKDFAKEMGLLVWYSCTVNDEGPLNKDILDLIDVVIMLKSRPVPPHIELSVAKDRDAADTRNMAMQLDPKTLLILEN